MGFSYSEQREVCEQKLVRPFLSNKYLKSLEESLRMEYPFLIQCTIILTGTLKEHPSLNSPRTFLLSRISYVLQHFELVNVRWRLKDRI